MLGCLIKESIELSEYDIIFMPWTIIKAQVLANIIVDFTNVTEFEELSKQLPNLEPKKEE